MANPAQPIVFHAGSADADILSQDVKDLHTYGLTFADELGHDPRHRRRRLRAVRREREGEGGATGRRSSGPRTACSVPARSSTSSSSRRPATRTPDGSGRGVRRLRRLFMPRAGEPRRRTTGRLSLLYRGDVVHTGFDNIAVPGRRTWSLVVEDARRRLHAQRNALDSASRSSTSASTTARRRPAADPRRSREGRDASATIDSAASATPGFQNDGDNEITGIHVSDGDPRRAGLLGATPRAVQGRRMADLLDAAARRQRDVGDHRAAGVR